MDKFDKKIFTMSLFFLGCSTLCVAQVINSRLKSIISINNTEFIEVYKCDRLPSFCYDTKDISIIVDGKISKCFKLLKTLDRQKSKKLVSILKSKCSYQRYSYDAFTTDYAVILFDNKKNIIGSVNFSFVCSNLYSDILLKEKQEISPQNPNEVGLSQYGKKAILKTIGILK